MKKYLFLILLITPLLSLADTAADSTWLVTHYTKRDVYITMRDGIRLYTAIYEPIAKGKHPILINRTCYSIPPYGDGKFKAFWNSHYMNYFKENYIMVMQDVRGKYMSEGEFMDVRPFNPTKKGKETDEASDTWDSIDWLIHNVKNNNQRVGIYGISYPGYYATMGALCGHPALKAASPQAPVTEWFIGDDFHHNGALMAMDAFGFYSGFGKPRREPTTKGSSGYQFTTKDNYKFYLETGAIKNLSVLMGDSIAFWKDLYSHPNYDQFWQDRNTRKYTQYIKPHIATLEVGGLFDAEDCYGAWNLYKSIEQKAPNNNKLVMGPWSHGGWARGAGEYLGNVRFGLANSDYYRYNVEIPFFNYYLLNKGNAANIKEATIFFSGANKWRTFSQWPPAAETPKDIYLNVDGSISWKQQSDRLDNFLKGFSDRDKIKTTIVEKVQERSIEASVNERMNYFMEVYGSKANMEKATGKTAGQIREETKATIKEQVINKYKNTAYRKYTSDPSKPVPYTDGVQMSRTNEYMTDDQRFAARRPDVLVYQTDALSEDVTLAGPVIADLYTAISTTDVDFVVKLIDVFPDNFTYNDTTDGKGNGKPYTMGGYQMLVRGEIMRGRYRNSFEKPEPFVPGAITEVRYALPDVAHVFKKGHRIMVQVQSSWFPLADRNPQQFVNIYTAGNNDFIPCDIKIYSGKDHPSRIILPVLK